MTSDLKYVVISLAHDTYGIGVVSNEKDVDFVLHLKGFKGETGRTYARQTADQFTEMARHKPGLDLQGVT